MMDTHNTGHGTVDPIALLHAVGISEGMVIADCGCGAEAPFAIAASSIVGPQGTVYALDVVKTALERVAESARRHNAENLQTIWTDLEMYGATRAVRTGSVDVAVLSNTLFQSQDHAGMFTEIARMVKKGGSVLVVDWKPDSDSPLGPPKEQRVQPQQIQQFAEASGFQFKREIPAGDDHWAAVYSRE